MPKPSLKQSAMGTIQLMDLGIHIFSYGIGPKLNTIE